MRSRMKGGRNNSIDLGDEDPSPLLQKARNASSESLPTVNQDVDLMEMEEEPPVGYYQQKSPPRERFPWKEAMLAVILTLGGVVFLPIGLYELVGRGDLRRGTPFLCISPFILLPGVYHLTILVRAYLGHRGYRYSQLIRRPH
ncbi:hypothetical protein AAMO2058_001253000 [Amorphochlora amoebiformis]